MDPRTYLETHGAQGVDALVAAVNVALESRGRKPTTAGYFKQIAYGHRRPSFELAETMVERDPKSDLDLVSLMNARKAKEAPSTGEGGHAAQ